MSLARLDLAARHLCDIVDELATDFPAPKHVRHGDGFVQRHDARDQTNGLACYLKAVKICSTLNGAIALTSRGFAQEAHALCRIADEQAEDIHFLLPLRGKDQTLSARQQQALQEFFQEEFKDPGDPVGSSQPRNRVGRKEIHAATMGDAGLKDSSRALDVANTLHRAFSGYVHGAYGHIMELYSDASGRYHMQGAPERIAEAIDSVPDFVYRAMLAVEHLVKAAGRADLLPKITGLNAAFAQEFNLLPPEGASLLAARAARYKSDLESGGTPDSSS